MNNKDWDNMQYWFMVGLIACDVWIIGQMLN